MPERHHGPPDPPDTLTRPGRVAELADAQASGACVRKDVGVQVPPRPPSGALRPRSGVGARGGRRSSRRSLWKPPIVAVGPPVIDARMNSRPASGIEPSRSWCSSTPAATPAAISVSSPIIRAPRSSVACALVRGVHAHRSGSGCQLSIAGAALSRLPPGDDSVRSEPVHGPTHHAHHVKGRHRNRRDAGSRGS